MDSPLPSGGPVEGPWAAAASYWERRARRFAGDGHGLRAVCSYAMPSFYNRAIQWTQRRALRRWLRAAPGSRALDIGCGIGRWSRHLAKGGVRVTGVDLSATMVREASARARREGVADLCRFLAGDLVDLDLGERFPLIIGVTVLQHIVDDGRHRRAIRRLAEHVEPEGRIVLLEASPSRRFAGCNGPNFKARSFDDYRAAFEAAGLDVEAVTGVDSTPIKRWILPRYRQWPRLPALAALALATGATLPFELTIARRLPRLSWHKVMVLRRGPGWGGD